MSYKRTVIQSPVYNTPQFFVWSDTVTDVQISSPYTPLYKYIYKHAGGSLTIAQGNVVVQVLDANVTPLDSFSGDGGDLTVTANGTVTSFMIGTIKDTISHVNVVTVTNQYALQNKQYALVVEGNFTVSTVGGARGIVYKNNGVDSNNIAVTGTSNIYLGNTASTTAESDNVSIAYAHIDTLSLTGNGVIVTFYGSKGPAFA